MAKIKYTIDGTDIETKGVHVSASSGVVDGLKMKEPFTVSWEDYNGQAIDLSAPRYEVREIKLDCWLKASDPVDFVTKVNSFLALFDKAGLRRLQIGIDANKPLVYEVYRASAVDIEKKWRSAEMIGTFTLTLVEPEPVKKVLKYTRTSDADKTVSITFESDYIINIYWGDGNTTLDEAEGTATHDFTADGDYIIIVTGNIDQITSFTTTGTVIWDKL